MKSVARALSRVAQSTARGTARCNLSEYPRQRPLRANNSGDDGGIIDLGGITTSSDNDYAGSILAKLSRDDDAAKSAAMADMQDKWTPEEVVALLDKFIVGQTEAKKAVAVAFRNRWRRQRVSPQIKEEIMPKNILMVGPTGVGKTEIARRLAKITNAPFVKVECTKYTEVGYHGKDVESIIEDLLTNAATLVKNRLKEKHEKEIKEKVSKQILDKLCGDNAELHRTFAPQMESEETMKVLDCTVEIDYDEKIKAKRQTSEHNLQFNQTVRSTKVVPVPEAYRILFNVEMDAILEAETVMPLAVQLCEEDGIVVLDEIDKIVVDSNYNQGNASSEGVQQDLLPLVEGTTVTTKSGHTVRTERILFIASGAFHKVKPKDMLAELQGRLPIRVELQPLSLQDFYRILTEPKVNLIRQQIELMKTEGVFLNFTDAAVRRIASLAHSTNRKYQNTGARRLNTIIERVCEDISFDADAKKGETVTITEVEVDKVAESLMGAEDLQKAIM